MNNMPIQNKLRVLFLAKKVVLNMFPFDPFFISKFYGSKYSNIKSIDIFQPFEYLDGQCYCDYLLSDLVFVETRLKWAQDNNITN
jgi:hypothetical protein